MGVAEIALQSKSFLQSLERSPHSEARDAFRVPSHAPNRYSFVAASDSISLTSAIMADSYLPTLGKHALETARQRRTSSFRRRLKRTPVETPDVAMHVLLPKIFGGEILAYCDDSESSSESDAESVCSPDSAVSVKTPPESTQDIPPITISFSHEIPATPNKPPLHDSKTALPPTDPDRCAKRRTRIRAGVSDRSSAAFLPKPERRPRYDSPHTSSSSGSNASTPRLSSTEHLPTQLNPAAVNRLSCALDQLCNLTDRDGRRTSTDREMHEAGGPTASIGGLLANGIQPTARKDSVVRGRLVEEGELVIVGRGKGLRNCASW